MNDAPEFPEYDVIDSSELDAAEAAAAREALGAGSQVLAVPVEGDPLGHAKNVPVDVDSLTDEQAVQLAELVRRARLKTCRCGKPAAYTVKDEAGTEFGLCKKHGKALYRRHNAPTMAVPRGRRNHSARGR